MIKNILFDLDGTLVNTGFGILASLKSTIEEMKLRNLSDAELKRFIGPPLKEMFCELFEMSQQKAGEAVELFREYYGNRDKLKCELYDGVEHLLIELQDNGCQLFVATSKPTVYAEEILIHLGLAKYFVEIAGSNLDNTRGKKAEIIGYIIDKHNLNKDECVMIGDKAQDLRGAKESEIKGLGVTYGFGSLDELQSVVNIGIASTTQEVYDILSKMNKG